MSSAAAAVRKLGRFELRQLLGRSARSMAWRAYDPASTQELVQPPDQSALNAWLEQARRAARLVHPNLAPAIKVGEQGRWPYVAYDNAFGLTLAERPPSRDGEAAAASRAGWRRR